MASGLQTQGTVMAHSPFDAEKDCQVLRKAMKGAGKLARGSSLYGDPGGKILPMGCPGEHGCEKVKSKV